MTTKRTPLCWQYRQQVQPSSDTLRTSLRWAIVTIHNGVLASEYEFKRLHYYGLPPLSLPSRRLPALRDIDTFCAALDYGRFTRLTVEAKLDTLVRSIYGLGYAKAAFALTCARLADVGCLDVHMATRHSVVTAGGKVKTQWRSGAEYLRDLDFAWGNRGRRSGRQQWREYAAMRNGAGRRTRQYAHEGFFGAVGVNVTGQKMLALDFSNVA